MPVYKTSSFVFNDTEHAANLFGLRELGNIYTRLMNPTTDVLEQLLPLSGGAAGLGVASGTSGVSYRSSTRLRKGRDRFRQQPVRRNLYPVQRHPFQVRDQRKFVDPNDPQNYAAAITDKTKALFAKP